MKLTKVKLEKLIKFMIKKRIKPVEVYFLLLGDRNFMVPVSQELSTYEIIKIKFPIEIKE